MNTEKLCQYSKLKKEEVLLERRLRDLNAEIVTDVVRGSMDEHPYTEHSIKICGVGTEKINKTKRLLCDRQRRIRELQCEIEEWIDTINVSEIRQIIEWHYIIGKSWNATAVKVFGTPCGDAARKKVKRF